MPTISQSLVVPTGLVDGQTASAGQITPLYTAMNNFVIPYLTFQPVLADNTAYPIAAAATQSFVVNIPQTKTFFFFIPYTASAQHTTWQLFLNGVQVTATTDCSTQVGAGNQGIIHGFCGPHDATVTWPLFISQLSSTDTGIIPVLYANPVPNANITSFGVKCIAQTLTIKNIRIFGEV